MKEGARVSCEGPRSSNDDASPFGPTPRAASLPYVSPAAPAASPACIIACVGCRPHPVPSKTRRHEVQRSLPFTEERQVQKKMKWLLCEDGVFVSLAVRKSKRKMLLRPQTRGSRRVLCCLCCLSTANALKDLGPGPDGPTLTGWLGFACA